MTRAQSGCVVGLLACLAACGGEGDLPQHVVVDGVVAPTAVVHEEQQDVYLVASAGGQGEAAGVLWLWPDGRIGGRWSKSGPDGASMRSTAGMALSGEELFVADGDRIVVFDRQDGSWLRSLEVVEDAAVQDVAFGPDGRMWFTATGKGGGVFVHEGEAPRRLCGTPEVVAAGQLVVITTGAYVLDQGADRFLQVDNGGRVTPLLDFPQGRLCGLVRPGPGQWWTASDEDGAMLVLDTMGGIRSYPGLQLDQPMDFELDRRRKRLLIPQQGGEVLLRRL